MIGLNPNEIDVVYPVKMGNRNEELRYSLRALQQHVPHRNVWIMGAKPGWVQNAYHIPYRQGINVRLNTTLGMKAACEDPRVSDPFLWFNDDYFCMKPIPRVRRMNRGPIDDVIVALAQKKDGYAQGMVATKNLLVGLGYTDGSLLSYELHMPLYVYKSDMLAALEVYYKSNLPNLHKRTLYGNMMGLGGMTIPDNKIVFQSATWDRDSVWISTSDKSFREFQVGAWIRGHFPEPSLYEI